MSFMSKFESTIEKVLVPVATKLNSQRHICAIRDAFILTFPLTMAGSLMILINNVILAPTGFIASLLRLHTIFPGLAEYQAIFTPVINGSTEILSILVVFLIARNIAKALNGDDLLTGLTAISIFFIIYPPKVAFEGGNYLNSQYFGAQGLFVAIIIGMLVAEILCKLSKSPKLEIKMPEQVPPAVARTFKILIPIILVTLFFAVANFVLLKFAPGGIHTVIYNLLQAPMTALGSSVFSIVVVGIVANLLWVMGIHGPNTLSAVITAMTAEAKAANLAYITETGTAWGAPYPINYTVYNVFGTMGGSGSTIALIIAIFLVSKLQEQKDIAKLSIGCGLFNINEPVIFGLPIVLNPLMLVPFIFVPIVSTLIAVLFINLKLMPPAVYDVPWTTPPIIFQFLATGGHWMGAVVGAICLAVSTLIYIPFVLAGNKVAESNNEIEEMSID
ncbi:PTS system oligo-beta-mannoside-specific EIIC component [uncultured Clostridium sp.]|uniref:PTS sugar transporter subunit IIC n=1 Tax=uncultured Clostridium sp. TaxID=59620 RepID=UPI0008225DDA|nr:PTS transporter subunit EIIC [uncultured Clostridium sp.]SCI76717.1 PTS system oligo-beta-mannoside-specific EIIC component [uncultured Clostridium sp.]